MAKNSLIENAKITKEIWENLKDNKIKTNFKKNFHIRPTEVGITLVSTHFSKPMNGNKQVKIREKSNGKASYYFDENFIKECANLKFNKEDWEKIGITKQNKRTEPYLQAWLINVINNCENKYNRELTELKQALNLENIYFIGSELILQENETKGGQKPDIVIHDGNGVVYFLELKTSKGYSREDGKSPEEQVKEYIKQYEGDKQYEMLLLNYPMIEKLNKIKEYKGFVVKGDKNTEKIYKDEDGIIRIPEK